MVLTSCKSKQNVIKNDVVKKLTAKKIIKKHKAVSFDATSLDAKLKVGYFEQKNGNAKRYSFTVRLRVQKDSTIWMKGSKGIIPVFKIKITPSTFSYYSLINKQYFDGDYFLLEKILGTKISFNQLQNLLFGESILDLKKQKYLSYVADNSYVLSPKKQNEMYRISFLINPNNFKLKSQILKIDKEKQKLQIDYSAYTYLDTQYIPKKIGINISKKKMNTKINIDFKSLTINKKVSTPYRVPSSYKRIKI